MLDEWRRWPNDTPLLGPLGLIGLEGLNFVSVPLAVISLAALFAFLILPSQATATASIFGSMNWLWWGCVAQGVGC